MRVCVGVYVRNQFRSQGFAATGTATRPLCCQPRGHRESGYLPIILTHMKHDDLLRCRTADGGLRREKSLTAWETTLDPRYMDSSRPADVLFCEQIARSAFTALRTGVS
jgi:hypothetical protein